MNRWMLFSGAAVMIGLGFMTDKETMISCGLVLLWIGTSVQ